MKKLDIQISKAQLVSFGVSLDDGKPSVHAKIGLMTEGGKQITDYMIYTSHYDDSKIFKLPVGAIPHIVALGEILERVVVEHCNDSIQAIAAGDGPINLDDIPL